MEISLSDLASCLYGFDDFFGDRPASPHPLDRPIQPVIIVPYSFGLALMTADVDNSTFHVELFPPHKAEVWSKQAWDESIIRRLRIAGKTTFAERSPIEATRAALESQLITFFRSYLSFRHARLMAELLISGPENPGVLRLAGLPVELANSLTHYRNALTNPAEDPQAPAASGRETLPPSPV